MKRFIDIVLCLVFLSLTARGAIQLATMPTPSNTRTESAQTTGYILTALFGSLSLVFGYRALKKPAAK